MRRINPAALARLSPEERAAIADELAALDARTSRNPLETLYPYPCHPCRQRGRLTCEHSKQHKFLVSRDRIKAFFGGNQSGKTTAGVLDDLIQCVDRSCLPEHLRQYKQYEPPFKCRIGTPDLGKTMEQVQEKIEEIVPRDQLVGGSWTKAYHKVKRVLSFKNGSFIEFLSYDQDRDQWAGATRHRVHYDEEPPEIIRNEGRARVLRFGGDEIFTMTPLDGMTWMFDGVYEKRFDPGVTVVEVDMDDNPHLNSQAKAAFLTGLSSEERQMRKEGRFVHFGGLVLWEFNEDLHIVDPVPPSHVQGMTVLVGIDPGLVQGGVVWIAFDRDDVGLIFDELYPAQQTIPMTAAQIHAKNAAWGIKPEYYVIDPSARNRSHINAENVESAYMLENIFTVPGQNQLEAGAFQIKRRLAPVDAQENPLPPALYVTRNCRNWLWERQRWRRKQTDDGSFAVIPGNDHLLDPSRYVLMERSWGPPLPTGKSKRYGFTPNRVDPWEYRDDPPRHGPMGPMS